MKQFKNMFDGKFTIKREVAIINDKGEVSANKYLGVFGESNPYIRENISESKIDMVTSPCSSIDKAVDLLEDIQSVVITNLEDEYLWKQSDSPKLEDNKFSRVSFEVSFSNNYLNELYIEGNNEVSFNDFKNEIYLKVNKYLMKNIWFLNYITHASFSNINDSQKFKPVNLRYNSLGNIESISLQFLEVNPFTSTGVSNVDLKYIHLYMLYSLQQKDFSFDKEKNILLKEKNKNIIQTSGLNFQLEVQKINNEVRKFFDGVDSNYNLEEIFESIEERLVNNNLTYINKLKELYSKSNYFEYNLSKAKEEKRRILEEPFKLYSYPKLELSTKILIKKAIEKGVHFEVLDENTNFITLTSPNTGKVELIQQATKTNLDKYANVLAMENKVVTKMLLERDEISIPKGLIINSNTKIPRFELETFENKGVVIKPNTTNFGEGITIFPEGASAEKIEEAIEFSLSKDDTVLIEPFIKGKEYRFLIIANEVVGVLHRRAANIVGNGELTIEELIKEKNEDILRGVGYVTPLEKIKITKIEIDFLKEQGLSLSSIPKKEEMIFLRENSNISTGGDSIDFTDEMHKTYKDIALKSCKALGVNISGVDMIIEDIYNSATPENYSILELNFNPAIHIHTYPFVGKNRKPAEKILKALFQI